MYEIKSPLHEFQSPWIYQVYNDYMSFKKDGFLVEIGVGHTVAGSNVTIGPDCKHRNGSNTADLMDLGWTGIYIDPVKEYCDELKLSHPMNLDRMKIVNIACSDIQEEQILYLGDTLNPTGLIMAEFPWLGRKVICRPTSEVLSDCGCPKHIDVMSVDVEGFEGKVLKGLDFEKHQPRILVVEINQVSTTEIDNILRSKSKKYTMIQRDDLNAVWVLDPYNHGPY
jgi:hypothetical protein